MLWNDSSYYIHTIDIVLRSEDAEEFLGPV